MPFVQLPFPLRSFGIHVLHDVHSSGEVRRIVLLSLSLLLLIPGGASAQQPNTTKAERPAPVLEQWEHARSDRLEAVPQRRGLRTASGSRPSELQKTPSNLFMRSGTTLPGRPGVTRPSVSTGDVNGDGTPDILLVGTGDEAPPEARLYLGAGDGTFTSATVDLPTVGEGASAIADVNEDGHPDLLMTGSGPDLDGVGARLYLGNGDGTFERANADLMGLERGSISAADVNGDGHPDVLLTGQDEERNKHTKLYLGDGTGSFIDADAGLQGVAFGSSSIADVNGDGHPDLLISGNSDNGRITKLYLGTGNGTFSEANASLKGVYDSSTSIADVNGDGNLDLLITGADATLDPTTTLYLGNGDGTFPEANADLTDVSDGSTSIADVNEDGRADLLVTGNRTATLYLGGPNGAFQKADAGLTGVRYSATSITDVDTDGDLDLLIAGNDGLHSPTRLYVNRTVQTPPNRSPRFPRTFRYDHSVAPGVPLGRRIEVGDPDGDRVSIRAPGNPNVTVEDFGNGVATVTFTPDRNQRGRDVEIVLEARDSNGATVSFSTTVPVASSTLVASPIELAGVGHGSTSIADVDGNGMPDLLVTGEVNGTPTTTLYMGQWGGGFSKANTDFGEADFEPLNSSVSTGDINRDGQLDILITRSSLFGSNTTLYLQKEPLHFSKSGSKIGGDSLYTKSGLSTSIADVNSDGNPDVLLSGGGPGTTLLYLGNGRGSFTEADIGLPGVFRSSNSIADINGDGNLDIILTGFAIKPNRRDISHVYLGNGNGTFRRANAGLERLSWGDTSVGDVNKNGHPDLLITGVGNTKLYLGNGDGTFREANAGLIDGAWGGETAITDLNGDGNQDLLVTGYNGPDLVSLLYLGDGTGRFERAHAGLADGWNSSASVGDVDRDGDQDLLMTVGAYNGIGGGTTLDDQTILYENIATEGVPEPQLLETYPNPARNRVTVRYGVPEDAGAARASFEIYDVLGRRVKSVPVEAGRHRRQFQVDGLASGVYFLRLDVVCRTKIRKLTVVR